MPQTNSCNTLNACDKLRLFDRRGKQDDAGRRELQALVDAAQCEFACDAADLQLIFDSQQRIERMVARWGSW